MTTGQSFCMEASAQVQGKPFKPVDLQHYIHVTQCVTHCWWWYLLQSPFPVSTACSFSVSQQFPPLFGFPQTLTSAPSREPVTTPASTTPAASTACATRDTSCTASPTVEVSFYHVWNIWDGCLTQLKCVRLWVKCYGFVRMHRKRRVTEHVHSHTSVPLNNFSQSLVHLICVYACPYVSVCTVCVLRVCWFFCV